DRCPPDLAGTAAAVPVLPSEQALLGIALPALPPAGPADPRPVGAGGRRGPGGGVAAPAVERAGIAGGRRRAGRRPGRAGAADGHGAARHHRGWVPATAYR